MDEDATLPSPVDAMGPWTIKSFPTTTRNKVIAFARKEGLTVGQWIERRVEEYEDMGAPVRVSPGQPGSETGALVPVSPGLQPRETGLRDLVSMARELSPNETDTSLLRLARAAVRDQLQSFRRPR
jgi:hypothetical protein